MVHKDEEEKTYCSLLQELLSVLQVTSHVGDQGSLVAGREDIPPEISWLGEVVVVLGVVASHVTGGGEGLLSILHVISGAVEAVRVVVGCSSCGGGYGD